MDQEFNTILSVILVPQIVALIVEKDGYNDFIAINEFYNSKLYDLLSEEDTKMWHYSPLALYTMWKSEKETGEILFPEG